MQPINRNFTAYQYSRAQGAALVIGLFFLVMILLGVTVAFRGSILQERMAGGLRNQSLSESAADSALRNGEQWVRQWTINNANAIMVPGERSFVLPLASESPVRNTAEIFRTTKGWMNDGNPFQSAAIGNQEFGKLSEVPRFIVEVMNREIPTAGVAAGPTGSAVTSQGTTAPPPGGGNRLYLYRITARGAGGTSGVVELAESTFSVTL